ncbi:MAG: hypothetical protein WKG01_08210 [Kofleriaceae bacterium]
MRAPWLFLLPLLGCATAAAPDVPTNSLREQLATETALAVSASAGAITAARWTPDGWETGVVALTIDRGELAVLAEPSGALLVQRLELALAPIEIPSTVIGRGAVLTDVHLALATPTRVPATWLDDRRGHASASLPLELSWSLVYEGRTTPLGVITLPPLPLAIELVAGDDIGADVQIDAPGTVWSWAGLVRLGDLTLALAASSER